MIKKGFLLLVLLSLAGLSFLAAAGNKEEEAIAENKRPQVAVCLPGSVEFFMVMRKGMDKAASEYGIDLIYSDADWKPDIQLNQVEDFVARGVDAVMLCAGDPQALMPAIDVCNRGGVPLITFTNALGPNPDGTYKGIETFIGINDEVNGELLGQMAHDLLGDRNANIVLIEGAPGTAPQRLRTKGFEREISKYPGYNIIYRQAIEGWAKEGALYAMEAFLQTGKEVDLVASHWHAGAAAAAQALKEAGVTKKVYIAGIEFSKELKELIAAGEVDATTNPSISGMGYEAVETMAKFLNGESVPKSISIVPPIVTVDNVASHNPEL